MNLKEDEQFVEMIQRGAELRGDKFVSKKYIKKALSLIEEGKVEVEKYPTGVPTLLGAYQVALNLYKKDI